MKREANHEKILTRLTLGGSEPSPAATPGESPRRHDIDVAVANAIYHATGKRVRDLPVTLDKLL
jgi:CO/xanthine dehydrogenase Mo-binding subunit